MIKEKCVMCGCQTNYDIDIHIDYRYGYVEGVGQLCIACYEYKPKTSESMCDNSKKNNIYSNNNV